jgi:hypothetical protein
MGLGENRVCLTRGPDRTVRASEGLLLHSRSAARSMGIHEGIATYHDIHPTISIGASIAYAFRRHPAPAALRIAHKITSLGM